ncbi:FAD-binding protein [Rhodococcus pyridinivorans]|uniref:FAD-binding protein n=1 Tax=Rhodococcus pyridinivorans TaxID=103816 RepID=UPI001D13B29D|nr:FAD-binding protein [Rhodococcus pyridinivorans]WMM74981.1 FAD-binding protein [Rhodococcus pyridinivorans]
MFHTPATSIEPDHRAAIHGAFNLPGGPASSPCTRTTIRRSWSSTNRPTRKEWPHRLRVRNSVTSRPGCETVSELESEMGLPAGTLGSTVELYNRHAESGTDPVLGKKAEWVRPLRSPIAAIDLRGMTEGFSLGRLQTSVDSEVLHVDGDPIPGLYAAGRCTSGLSAWGYCSGISLGDGSFFGRRAGMRAAAK